MSILPRFWRTNFLGTELGLAVLATIYLIYWGEGLGKWVVLSNFFERSSLENFFGTVASTFGALLGFTIATATFLISSFDHERMLKIRDGKSYRELWKTFVSTIRWLGAGTMIALVNLVINTSGTPNRWLVYLLGFSVLLAIMRIFRCIWILENVIKIITIK